MSSTAWLGKDEHQGVPSQTRPALDDPPQGRLDAVFAMARPYNLAASPDGSEIAFVLANEGVNDVHVVSARGGQPRRLTTDRVLAPYWDDSAPAWSPDGTRLVYESDGDAYVVPATGGAPKRIEGVSPVAWLDDDRIVGTVERERSTRLVAVDVADPWPRPFGPVGGDVGAIDVGDNGRVVAVFWPKDDFSRSDIVVADPTGEWEVVAGQPDTRALSPAIHGSSVAYVIEEDDWRAVYVADLASGEHRLLAKDAADFGELVWSPDGRLLAATRSHRGQSDLVTISLDGRVDTVADGGFWESPVWAGDTLVAVYESFDTAPRLVRLAETREPLFDGAPLSVAAATYQPFDRVTYASTDDLEIEGFLFRPGDTTRPVPAVVYPHGGPTDAYGDGWDGHAQYFLDKGYAWFAINFRGSTTYGRTFERANHDVWGVADTEDCMAAARYLQSLGWVDPDRIAIFGASYGSYMALTSLVHPDNPFACGVLKYGDSDILTSWAQGDRGGREDLERMMSHPRDNRAAYRAGSPIHEVERLDRPLLIAHGEMDARVNPKQAEELVEELRKLGKQFEYVTYRQEAHGFLRREPQLDFYRRLERFLDWHLM